MSGCEDIKERLCEFMDGELSPSDRAVVESHIQECSACRTELDTLRQASTAVHSLERRPAPAAILAGVRAALKEAPVQAPNVVQPEPSFWWRRALSAAAVIMVAALVYLAYNPPPAARHAAAPQSAKTKTAASTPVADAAKRATPKAESLERREEKEALPNEQGDMAAQQEEAALPFAAPSAKRRGATSNVVPETKPVEKPRLAIQGEKRAQTEPDYTGTPPHVVEGQQKGLADQPVIERIMDLAKSKRSKSEEKELDNSPANDKLLQIAKNKKASKPAPEPTPNAPVVQSTPPVEVAQAPTPPATKTPGPATPKPADTVAERSRVARKFREVAQQQQQGARAATENAKADAKQTIDVAKGGALKESKLENAGKMAEQAKDHADDEVGQTTFKKKSPPAKASVAGTRRVISVPQRDVARVLDDLRRLAESSGGRLDWQPALAKKEVQAKQQLFTQDQQASNRVLIHVPQENMNRVLRSATAYSPSQPQEGNADPEALAGAQRSAQMPQQQRDEQLVQLVIEILPQGVAQGAASQGQQAPATNDAQIEPAK